MKITLGILAHVDAGKTTLSEQLLYQSGSIRSCGRVDHKNTFMDNHTIEQQRGITVFSEQAGFQIKGNQFFLVDTPGHADFTAEMERTLKILDYAVVVISSVEGIQGHTETIWRLLEQYKVPVIFFLNKTDRAGADPVRTAEEIQDRFHKDICCMADLDFTSLSEEMIDQLAGLDDDLLVRYLEEGYERELWMEKCRALILSRRLFPCFQGSALNGIGIQELLNGIGEIADTKYTGSGPLAASAYKVSNDLRNNRIVYLKILNGTIKVKDLIGGEKINQLRTYQGNRYEAVNECTAGDLCAMIGPSEIMAGDLFGLDGKWASPAEIPAVISDIYGSMPVSPVLMPLLTAKVIYPPDFSAYAILEYLRKLEDEEPLLKVEWNEALKEIRLHIMGSIQLEILHELMKERFGVLLDFGDCEILYKETIKGFVVGYGHFEPLRHYAEVHLRIEEGERGSGIKFSSECSTDVLAVNWQRLVKTHIFEREHKGVLTGSVLTDVKITLLTGKAHEKHTEGGDFREASYRAVRQGLEQADSVLLEPYYQFEFEAETELMGKLISDIQRMSGLMDAPEVLGKTVRVTGSAPVAKMMNYNRRFLELTKGQGRINLLFDGYRECHNTEEVIEKSAYERQGDAEHTSDSVFCSHGSGFVVHWDKVKEYMHCL